MTNVGSSMRTLPKQHHVLNGYTNLLHEFSFAHSFSQHLFLNNPGIVSIRVSYFFLQTSIKRTNDDLAWGFLIWNSLRCPVAWIFWHCTPLPIQHTHTWTPQPPKYSAQKPKILYFSSMKNLRLLWSNNGFGQIRDQYESFILAQWLLFGNLITCSIDQLLITCDSWSWRCPSNCENFYLPYRRIYAKIGIS